MNRDEIIIRLKQHFGCKTDSELAQYLDTTKQSIYNYKTQPRHDLQTAMIVKLLEIIEKKKK